MVFWALLSIRKYRQIWSFFFFLFFYSSILSLPLRRKFSIRMRPAQFPAITCFQNYILADRKRQIIEVSDRKAWSAHFLVSESNIIMLWISVFPSPGRGWWTGGAAEYFSLKEYRQKLCPSERSMSPSCFESNFWNHCDAEYAKSRFLKN